MLQCNRFLRIFFIMISLLFSCPVFAARLFYLEETATRCEAKTVDLPSRATRTVFIAPKEFCRGRKVSEDTFLWDLNKNQLSYFYNGEFFTQNLKDVPKDGFVIPNATASAKSLQVDALWIDLKTNNPRVASIVTAPDESIKVKNNTLLFEGKTYDVTDLLETSLPLGIVVVNEWQNGVWQRIATVPTTTDACDTLGLDVITSLTDQKKLKTVSLRDLILAGTCSDSQCDSPSEVITKRLKMSDSVVKRIDAKRILVSRMAESDYVSAASPVYVCEKDCQKNIQVKVPTYEQMSLTVKDRWLLVAEEYANTKARVVALKTGKVILTLPENAVAVWWPE